MEKIIYQKKIGNLIYQVYNERPNRELFGVDQVHGNTVVNIMALSANRFLLPADGIYSSTYGTSRVLAIRTADCVPIVVQGREGHALLHAGWRGIAQQIILTPQIRALVPESFFLGPHIGPCCYSVGKDFLSHFPPSKAYHYAGEQIYFSLAQALFQQIEAEYPDAKIEAADICTSCVSDYHSFRRDQSEKRNWNLLLEDR